MLHLWQIKCQWDLRKLRKIDAFKIIKSLLARARPQRNVFCHFCDLQKSFTFVMNKIQFQKKKKKKKKLWRWNSRSRSILRQILHMYVHRVEDVEIHLRYPRTNFPFHLVRATVLHCKYKNHRRVDLKGIKLKSATVIPDRWLNRVAVEPRVLPISAAETEYYPRRFEPVHYFCRAFLRGLASVS